MFTKPLKQWEIDEYQYSLREAHKFGDEEAIERIERVLAWNQALVRDAG